MRGVLTAIGLGLFAATTGCEAIIGSHDLALAPSDAAAPGDVVVADTSSGDADATSADAGDSEAALAQGQLVGVSAMPVNPVHLTALGTSDWAHWGLATAQSFTTKATGGGKISNATAIGTAPFSWYNTGAIGFSWSNGAPPDTKVTATTTGISVTGTGNGFSFSVPAGTSSQVLKVFVGGVDSTGSFVAHLSDGSAPDYTDATHSGGKNGFDVVFTLTFNAMSAGQTLLVTWTMSAGKPQGLVTLESAALQ